MSKNTSEIQQLQSQIAKEVNSDAPAIAQGIFGDNKNHPDMTSVPNAQLDQLYVQKFQQGDRQWLQAEARRDPNQFMDIAKRIGVTMPDPNAPPPPSPGANQQALAKMLASATAGPTAPALAAPGVPPGSGPAALPLPALPAAPLAPVGGGMAPSVALAPPPVPAAPVPLILGPNGQPLPPSGVPS